VFTTFSQSLTNTLQAAQDVNVDEGVHHLVIVGYQDDGGAVVGDLFFSAVTATYANCIPSQPGAMFCHPLDIDAVGSPVQISAGASAENGYITALRLYVDDVPQLTIFNPQQSQSFAINEPLAISHVNSPEVALVPHTVVLVGYDSTGGVVTATQDHHLSVSVGNPPQVCPAPDAPGVNVCSPNSCSGDGVFSIRATGTGASGIVDHMELWADGSKLADFPGGSVNTNYGRPLLGGFMTLTLVEVDSNGDYIPSDPIITHIC
jgi:hypothetical protein